MNDDREIVNGLPRSCYAQRPSDGSLIVIKRGMSGFYTASISAIAAELNEARGVSPEQALAMVAGSMFSWTCPAAMTCAEKEGQS